MTATATRTAIWLRIFCAILLLSLGFGHKPLHAKPSSDPASSFYLLPDGTYADLCIDSVDHGKPEKSWFGSGCDLCRLASGILPPCPPAEHASVSRDCSDIVFSVRVAPVDAAAGRPGSPVRGPPSLFA